MLRWSALLTAATMVCFGVSCASGDARRLYGQEAPTASQARTLHITPATTHVHVRGGETVRFVMDGKAFQWSFTAPSVTHFDLREVMPPDMLQHSVLALIEPDPRYTP